MTDHKALARVAVLQAGILNVLKDLDAETRDELKRLVDSEEAIPVRTDGRKLGRVRRNKETVEWKIYDWGATEKWIKATVPGAWVVRETIDPIFLKQIRQSGQYIDDDGVVHEVPGMERDVRPGNLVVETTDDVEDWARQMLGVQL